MPRHRRPPAHRTALAHARALAWPEGSRRIAVAAVRGMLVSPWLAAGAGLVVAATALMYSPHSVQFGNAITVTKCRQSGCGRPAGGGSAAPLPASTGRPQPQQPAAAPGGAAPAPAPARDPAPPSAAAQTVSYDVLYHDQLSFGMLITVRAQAPGPWQLAFTVPGAANLMVSGAEWQPSGPGGGTASGYPGSGQFMIRGSGAAGPPSGCRFNGAPCRFVRS